MISRKIWFNEEYLPNESEPQRSIHAYLPTLFPLFSLPITIGFQNHPHPGTVSKSWYFIVLGFGLSYNVNWDEDQYEEIKEGC